MDSFGLDVTSLADLGLTLKLGDQVELIGPDQTLEEVARAADTIPYEILTRLGRRYARTYLDRVSSPASEAPTLEALSS
jgi:alanine racemase